MAIEMLLPPRVCLWFPKPIHTFRLSLGLIYFIWHVLLCCISQTILSLEFYLFYFGYFLVDACGFILFELLLVIYVIPTDFKSELVLT